MQYFMFIFILHQIWYQSIRLMNDLRSGRIYQPLLMPLDPATMEQILQQLVALNTKLDNIGNHVTNLEMNPDRVTTQNNDTIGVEQQGSAAHIAQPCDINVRNVFQKMAPRFNPLFQGNKKFNFQDDITKRVKIDAPSFDGKHDMKLLTNWLVDMD